jgi:hypothetical protein
MVCDRSANVALIRKGITPPARSKRRDVARDGANVEPAPVTTRIACRLHGVLRGFNGRLVVETVLTTPPFNQSKTGRSILLILLMSADAAGTYTDSGPRLLLTAPWETVFVRKGDALGLRALADQFADSIAPDFSNRIQDGRWVTVLAWCLARSQEVFHAGGGRTVSTRSEQSARYAWLRPLELMWVARTIALAQHDWRERYLAGQRNVRPWSEGGRTGPRFGMSTDQFSAYRQTGMYGGYRLAFRRWPQMTTGGDGWTPGPGTNKLAKWLDERLGAARPEWRLHSADGDDDSLSARSANLGRGDEPRWWLQKWWNFDHGGRRIDETLPRWRNDFEMLPEAEILRPIVFGTDRLGKRRFEVAREVAKCPGAEHIDICAHLACVFGSDRTIKMLPRFSRLADAGMEVMDIVADALVKNSYADLAEVAALPAAGAVCRGLMSAARDWREHAAIELRHIETAHRFANAIQSSQPVDCIGALLRHHEYYGGGLRWFVLRNGRIEPRTPVRSGSSRYRFRLWSLCRLATQCGVLRNMPPALRDYSEVEPDEAVG